MSDEKCQFDLGGWCMVENELKDFVCKYAVEREYMPPMCTAKPEDLITEEDFWELYDLQSSLGTVINDE